MQREDNPIVRRHAAFLDHASHVWIILAISLVLTFFLYFVSNHYFEKRAQEIFDEKTDRSLLHLQEHTLEYERTLKSGIAFLQASDYVSRDEWHQFVSTLDFPEIKAFGYTKIIYPHQMHHLETKMQSEGYPNFSIHPKGERPYYAPLLYIEPIHAKNSTVIGFDNASEPIRRKALEAARDSGKLSVSEGLKIIQQEPSDNNLSVLFFLPYYQSKTVNDSVEKRRKNITGFVSTPFLMADLMATNIQNQSSFIFSVDDITPNTSHTHLYDSNLTSYPSKYHNRKIAEIGGRIWEFSFSSTPRFDQSVASNDPIFLAIGGLIFDFTLFWVLIALFRSRQKLREQKSVLESSKAHLATILDSSNDGIHILDAEGNLIEYNRTFIQMLGYTEEVAASLKVFDWDAKLSEHEIRTLLAQMLYEPMTIESVHRRKDGSIYDAEITTQPILLNEKKVIYCCARDITERKKQLETLYLTHQMIDSANDMAFIIRIDNGYIEYSNKTAQTMTGYSLEEMRAIGIDGFRRPIKEQDFLDHLQELKTMGRLTDYAIVIRKDGSEFPVEANVRAVCHEGTDYNIAIVRDISENEAFNQKIAKTAMLLNEAQKLSKLGSWQLDLLTNELEWSDEIYSIFEIDPKTHTPSYEGFLNAIHPEDRNLVNTAYTNSVEHRIFYDYTHRLLMSDGRVKYVQEQGETFYDENGTPIESRGTVHDITKQKELENTLLEKNNILKETTNQLILATQVAKIGIWVLHFEDKTFKADERVLEVYEMSPELVGVRLPFEEWTSRCHPDDVQEAVRLLEQAAEELKPLDIYFRIVVPSGTKYIHSAAIIQYDILGNPIGILGTNHDITEQKVLENTLLQKNLELTNVADRLKLATQAAKVGIWVWHFCNNTLTWDSKMFELYKEEKHHETEIIPYDTWKNFVHPDDIQDAELELTSSLYFNKPFNTVFRIITPNGAIKYIYATSIVKYDEYYNPIYMVGTNRDITVEKDLNDNLLLAKEAAENANNAKSNFLANMSHEIRTPLNGVIGLIDLVLQTELTPLQNDYLIKSEMAAKALLNVLNSILDYSKIEANKLTLERIPFDLHEILENIHALFSYKAEEKRIDLQFHTDSTIPQRLLGDPLRLQQILSNLVGNAMKFTDEGFVHVSITAQTEAKKCKLTVMVTDSGIGLTAQQQENLFSPFYQADSSYTRKYGGSGLGLMITKELIELMGGTISVSSTPNGGSIFTFTALLDPYEFSVQEFDAIAMRDQYNILATTKEIHILLVEDNDLNVLVASERLKQMGLRVSVANNGLEAVEMVRDNDYDAVLMDLQMPVMDGFTATKEIRKMAGKEKLPIIALSAAVMKEDQVLSTQSGMNAHIAKPIDKVVLRDILAKWVKF